MPSLRQAAEQALRLAHGGDPGADRAFDIREVELLVCQRLAAALKAEALDQQAAGGDYLPPHALIANFEGVEVTDPGEQGYSSRSALERDVDLGPREGAPRVWGGESAAAVWGTEANLAWATGTGAYYGVPGALAMWATGDGRLWGTPGAAAARMTVERTAGSLEAYRIAVSGLEQGEYLELARAFLCRNIGRARTVIVLSGGPTSAPGVFSAAGITEALVAPDRVEFVYRPERALEGYAGLDVVPVDGLVASHELLAGLAGGEARDFGEYPLRNYQAHELEPARYARVELPTLPISLPHGLGIWRVGDAAGVEYVPVGVGQAGIAYAAASGIGEALEAVPGYEPIGRTAIRLNRAPKTVDLSLLVYDPAGADPLAPLPAPAELIADVVVEVAQVFAQARGLQDVTLDGPNKPG